MNDNDIWQVWDEILWPLLVCDAGEDCNAGVRVSSDAGFRAIWNVKVANTVVSLHRVAK